MKRLSIFVTILVIATILLIAFLSTPLRFGCRYVDKTDTHCIVFLPYHIAVEGSLTQYGHYTYRIVPYTITQDGQCTYLGGQIKPFSIVSTDGVWKCNDGVVVFVVLLCFIVSSGGLTAITVYENRKTAKK